MTSTTNIDFAIGETLKAHPDWVNTYPSTITCIIQNGMSPKNFTSTNGARQAVKNYRSIDFLKYALDELNNLYSALTVLFPKTISGDKMTFQEWNYIGRNFPEAGRIIDLYNEFSSIQGNVFSYYQLNQNRLFDLVDVIFKVRFSPQYFDRLQGVGYSYNQGLEFRQKTDRLARNSPTYEFAQQKIEESFKPYNKIETISFNQATANRCIREIMTGAQVKSHHNEYAIDGTLFATQDVGKNRQNQEDSTLIMTHPQNSEFKLLAVADGMGGVSAGEEVSNYTVRELSNWFANLDPNLYNDYNEIYSLLTKEVLRINEAVCKKYGNDEQKITAGSTLVCAIVSRYTTVILNIGDSRAYAAKDGRLNLITEDDSPVWQAMKDEVAREHRPINLNDISELRFAPYNFRITSCIGNPDLRYPQIRLVNNQDYDRLLLFSDGVHDVLSSEDIKVIANTTPPDRITQEIVATANMKNAQKFNRRGEIEKVVNAGKDNTTAAAYIRR